MSSVVSVVVYTVAIVFGLGMLLEGVWVTKGMGYERYGLRKVWVKRGSTVLLSEVSPPDISK
jgi:hypothetical protein